MVGFKNYGDKRRKGRATSRKTTVGGAVKGYPVVSGGKAGGQTSLEDNVSSPTLGAGVGEDCEDGACAVASPAVMLGDDDGYADELFDALDDDDCNAEDEYMSRIEELVPDPVLISRRCSEFGHEVGPIVMAQAEEALEWSGFFLYDTTDGLYTLSEVLIPDNQKLTRGQVDLKGHDVDKASRLTKAYNKDHKTNLAMLSYAHGHTGAVGHSFADDKVLDLLANRIGKTTNRVYQRPLPLIESATVQSEYGDGVLTLSGDELTDAIQRFIIPEDEKLFALLRAYGLKPDRDDFRRDQFVGELLKLVEHEQEEPTHVGFAISCVFNNKGDGPYIDIGISQRTVITRQVLPLITLKDVEHEVVDIPGQECFTKAQIEKVVKNNYVFPYKAPKTTVVGAVGSAVTSWVKGKPVTGAARPATGYPAAGAGFNTTHIAPTMVKKREGSGIGVEELANRFSFALADYLTMYMSSDCRYSSYVSRLLTNLYQQGTGVATGAKAVNPIGKGLEECVKELGPLYADGDEVPQQYSKGYMAATAARKIKDELMLHREYDIFVSFLTEFVKYNDLSFRSALLEAYIPLIQSGKAYAKIKQPDKGGK